jgi:hypothetical protein
VQVDARTARWLFWNGDRLLRFLAVAGAMIAALVMLSSRQSEWRAAQLHREWTDDASFTDLAVAQQIANGKGYTLDDPEGMPAQANTLWRLVVGQVARFGADTAGAAQGISLLSGLCLLVVLFRAVRSATGSAVCAAAAILGLAVSPTFLHLTSSPGPLALLALLVALAFDLHLRALHDDGRPLSAWTALALGAAVLIRPEAATLWLVFLIHAIADNVVERRGRERLELCAWNAAAGILLIGLCLWPLINLNARHLGNPWPTALTPSGVTLWEGWRYLVADFPTASPWMFLIALLGCASLLALPSPREGFRLAVLPLAGTLVPPACMIASAFLEADGAALMCGALMPTLLAFGCAGLARAAIHFAGPREWPAAGATAGVLFLGLAVHGHLSLATETSWREQTAAARADVRRILKLDQGGQALTLATDQPGWLSFLHAGVKVIDLSGRTSITVLRSQNASGRLDATIARSLIARSHAGGLVLWDPAAEPLLDRLDLQPWSERWQSESGWPRIRVR